jgi:hypothetical protein
MKYVPAEESPYALPTIELTRRNLEILLAKLDDHASARTIIKDGWAITAVEDPVRKVTPEEFIAIKAADAGLPPLHAASLIGDRHVVKAVENDEHYSDRPPGEMFMPTSGETL